MKKFIAILAVVFSAITINAQTPYEYRVARQKYQDGVYQRNIDNSAFNVAVRNIPKRKKGEKRIEYEYRFNCEYEKLYHAYFHYNKDGFPICANECTFCRDEAQARIDKIKWEEEEAVRQEELQKQEEERKYQLRLEEIKKEEEQKAKELRAVEIADSLRKVFVKTNLPRLKKFCEEGLKKSESFQRQLKQIENRRFAELDALERQYTGRLNGEIFITKKSELDAKWKAKIYDINEQVEEETKKFAKLKSDIIKEFNEFLSANGVKNVEYGDFVFGYYGDLSNGDIEKAFDNLLKKPVFIPKWQEDRKYKHTNYRIL